MKIKIFLILLLVITFSFLSFKKGKVKNETYTIQEEIKKADLLYEKKDYKSAFDIYFKYLELDMPIIHSKIAYMYRNGKGVPINYKKALELYTKTGYKGLYGSQLEAAYMYRYGIGTEINLIESYKWYKIVCEMHKNKGILNTLKNFQTEMTTHEIEIAETEYKEWKKSFFGFN